MATIPPIISVVVLVAQSRTGRVQDVPDADSGAHILDIDGGIQGKRIASTIATVDAVDTG